MLGGRARSGKMKPSAAAINETFCYGNDAVFSHDRRSVRLSPNCHGKIFAQIAIHHYHVCSDADRVYRVVIP